MNDTSDYVIVGYTDPSFSVQHVPILKNATRYIEQTANLLNWQVRPIPMRKKISRFIVLRDPFPRWLSAFTEDITVYINSRENVDERLYLKDLFATNNSNWFLDFLIDRDIFYFDTHAQLQVKQIELVLQNISTDRLTFIKLTDNFGYVLNHWLHGEGCTNNFNNLKVNARDKQNDFVYNRIMTYFMDGKNLKRKEKVIEYLQPDFELINRVNFINP